MTTRPWEATRPPTRAELHAKAAGVILDADKHAYFHGKRRLPNVTGILKVCGLVNFDHCKAIHRERGSAAHQACHFLAEGDLDRSTVDPRIIGYVDAYENFLMQSGIVPEHVEAVVVDLLRGFAGTADLIGKLPRSVLKAGVDIKTSESPIPGTGVQLALYSMGWAAMTGETIGARYAVHLRPDGTFRVQEYADRNDFVIAAAAVDIVNWRLRNRLLTFDEMSAA